MHTSQCVSDAELCEYREMFAVLDTRRCGTIATDDLRQLMRLLHLTPPVHASDEYLQSGSMVDFSEFVSIVSRCVQSDFTPEQLRNAFRVFESDALPPGHVAADVLVHALTTYGASKVSYDEALQLVEALNRDAAGNINYVDLVTSLTGDSLRRTCSLGVSHIHGKNGSSQNWTTVSQRMLQHPVMRDHVHSIYAMDMRNHGASAHAPCHTNNDIASDMEAFVLRQGAQQQRGDNACSEDSLSSASKTGADVIIGHSMGGLALMGMLLRRYNEHALLPMCSSSSLSPPCLTVPLHYFGEWGCVNARACAAAMRAVNTSCGYKPTRQLRDVLFCNAGECHGAVRYPVECSPSRIGAAVIVDITPVSLDDMSSTATRAPLDALRAMQQVNVGRLRNYADADAALREAGLEDRMLRGFIATNIVFGGSHSKNHSQDVGSADISQAHWRCNVDVLRRDYAQMSPSIVRWFSTYDSGVVDCSANVYMSEAEAKSQTPSQCAAAQPQPCTLPVLFVFGERSPYNHVAHRATLTRFFPNSTQVVIADAGHYVHYEKTDDFVNAVASFLCKHVWQHTTMPT